MIACMQWMEWLMAWTEKETEEASRAGDTALLLARTVEICSGRRRATEQDLELLLPDYSKLQHLTRCICSRLATEAPALVRILCIHRRRRGNCLHAYAWGSGRMYSTYDRCLLITDRIKRRQPEWRNHGQDWCPGQDGWTRDERTGSMCFPQRWQLRGQRDEADVSPRDQELLLRCTLLA